MTFRNFRWFLVDWYLNSFLRLAFDSCNEIWEIRLSQITAFPEYEIILIGNVDDDVYDEMLELYQESNEIDLNN